MWASPGSAAAIRRFFSESEDPPLVKLTRRSLLATATYYRHIDGRCYLGGGGNGHVLTVTKAPDGSGIPFALKVVPTSTPTHVCNEYQCMLAAANAGAPVVAPVVDSLSIFTDDECGGVCYLMHNVGKPFEPPSAQAPFSSTDINSAFDVLQRLHSFSTVHGDARTHNLVRVDGKLRWIDFYRASSVPSAVTPDMKRADARVLAASFLKTTCAALPSRVRTAVAAYEGTQASARKVATAVAAASLPR